MTRQILLVAPGRQDGYGSISAALRQASHGALLTLAAGRYNETLVITTVVTLAAEHEPGSVQRRGARSWRKARATSPYATASWPTRRGPGSS